MKRGFTKALALLLALVMLVGILPVSVLAANDDTDYLFIATDRHTNTSIIGNVINNMESYIGENELDYLALGGDMVGSGNSHPAYNSSTVLGEVTGATSSLSAANVDIVAGIHDMNVTDDAGIVLPYRGGGAKIYEGDRFYVYGVEEYCISEDSNESNWSSEAQKFVTWANGSDIDKSKVIVVVSHYPLHAKRNDNDGAYYWHQALNTVATGAASGDSTVERNILFFHGHNHTVDSNEYVYNVGDTMSIQNGSSTASETIYYTYATAGYLNQNSKATLVTITDKAVSLTKYSTSGSGTAMTSVDRVAEAAPTLSSIAVTGDTEYTVGGNELNLTVTASYDDGTTKDVTADATFAPSALTASGVYTVTASYGGMTDTIDVTVNLYDEVLAADGETLLIAVEAFSQGATALEVTWDDDAEAVLDDNGLYTDYVVYNLALTNPGKTTEYAMSIVDNMDTTNLAVYHVADDGTLTLVNHKIENDCVVFTTSLTGTFAYGPLSVPEGYTLTSVTLENIPTDLFVGGSLDLMNAVITATYTKEGAEDYVRQLTVYDYGETNFSGYDVNVAGDQTAVFTYEGVKATLDIHVWGHSFTEAGVTVALDSEKGAEYGVSAANVTESANANVAAAVADVMKEGSYVAYDITLTYSENYAATEDTKTVTLPIPENVTKPAVYYVSDDGKTVTNMGATNNGNGTVTFTTTHFSTYVIGESTEITVPEPETATGSGTVPGEKKTVYVLSSGNPSGNVLIVNGNSAGSGYYAVANNNGSVTATGVTIKSGDVDGDGDTEIYIELDDATNELWTVAGKYTFECEDGYLYRASTQNNSSYTPRINDSSTTWSYSTTNHRLSYTRNYYTYYLYYSSGWKVTTSASRAGSIYFYTPVEIDTTTTVSGTYSIAGEDLSVVVAEDTTANLSATLTFKPSDGGTATTEDVSTTATYEIVNVDANGDIVDGDPKDIISKIENGVVTFTGNYGTALVKISYTTGFGDVTNYITITAKEPTYVVEITNGDTHVEKGVTSSSTEQLAATVTYVDEEGSSTVESPTIVWEILTDVSDKNIATIDENGLLTFTGNEGTIQVQATYTVNGKDYVDIITVKAQKSTATTPSESTTDFPRWPNDGAVRFDKTASAVGNFSETGIAQVELSMAGIPFKTSSAIDVVIMLDMTGSMSDDAMAAAEESAIAFAEQIVKNDDGTYNNSRIAVLAFNSGSSSPYTYWELGTITADQWDGFCTAVRGASEDQKSGGTPYDKALEKCQSILKAAKTDGTGNDRQQFCVFVSDGGPTSYKYITNYDKVKAGTETAYTTATATATGGSNQSDSNFATIASYTHEYYSTLMKDDGVTMYSVLTGLVAANYPNCTTILQNIASDSSKAYVVEDGSDTSALSNAFATIAQEIRTAATNVEVEDVITDEYEMIFELPNDNIEGLDRQEFYIEVVDYPLDETTHERTGTSTIKQRIYLATDTGTDKVYISKIVEADGTTTSYRVNQAPTPVYTAKAKDTDKAYFDADGTYYPEGDGTHHMTSGAYVVLNDEGSLKSLHTANFTYVAATKQFNWTVTSMSETSEIALRYFVYLTNSGGVAADKQVDAGTYPTNKYATLTYTNFRGTECEQEFPIPQMTWNGAQVSYVFYLVNENGVPVNRAGREITFAEAIFVTDVFTYAITWNDLEQAAGLEADILAKSKLPSAYKLYDNDASYKVHVYEDEAGVNLNNHFVIAGTDGDTTTYVYNNKTDVTKYNEHGTYAANSTYLCKSYSVTATVENGVITAATYTPVTGETQVAWGSLDSKTGATQIGDYAYYVDEYGEVYTIVQKTDATAVSGFDFANTTVAFAVTWEQKLVEDTVVVDFGLPVDIDVVSNDFVYNYVTGIGATDPNYGINTGYKTDTPALTAQALTIDGHSVKIQDQNHIRFTPGSMKFDEPVEFYYETKVEVYENSQVVPSYMYSKVTVIPATSIYYEDGFVTYTDTTYTPEDGTAYAYGKWGQVGSEISATQDQDRPGESQISADLDADNIYGYDSAYENCTQYSLGGAQMVTVDALTGTPNTCPTATFTFTGTAFDIISLTDSDSGVIVVTVTDADRNPVAKQTVDNYYGYDFYAYYQTVYTYTETKDEEGNTVTDEEGNAVSEWVGKTTKISKEAMGTSETRPSNPAVGATYTEYGQGMWVEAPGDEAIWQVPVIKMDLETYGTYTVTIQVAYLNSMNHAGDNCYSFWMDAVRIYNPTENSDAENAYDKDNEKDPDYKTIRDILVDANDLTGNRSASGVVFIDGIESLSDVATYANPGPNNETYLAYQQAIAFKLIATAQPTAVHIGAKLAFGKEATLMVGGSAFQTLTTATDMYYDLTDALTWTKNGNVWESNVVVLSNGTKDAVISLTNIKLVKAVFGTVTTDGTTEDGTGDETQDAGVATVSVVSDATVTAAAFSVMRMLYAPVEEEVPVFEPEEFSANWVVATKMNRPSKLNILTSDDVAYVTVNGVVIENFRNNPTMSFGKHGFTIVNKYLWTYTETFRTAGTYSYEVIAYDENGVASEPIVVEAVVRFSNTRR